MVMLVDTHSHLDMLKEISIEEALQAAKEAGVEKILNPTAYAGDLEKVCKLAEKYENIYGMLGVHPSEIDGWSDDLSDKIRELAKSDKIVAIGEIGLDYHWDTTYKEEQHIVFREQLLLARRLNLPVMVHIRDAMEDTYRILHEVATLRGDTLYPLRGVVHCFSGSREMA